MNESIYNIRPARIWGFVLMLIFAMVTVATLSIIAGGWVVNWLIPGIKFEFACLIVGQGLVLAAIPLGIFANSFARHLEETQAEENYDDDDDEDEDNGEAAEWLAERIAELTLARMNQGPPKDRSYTAKARRK